MYKKLTIISIFLLSVASLFANGAKENKANIENGSTEKVLHLAGGNVGTLNPFQHMNRGPGIFRTFLVFDSLLEKDESGLIPWLASSYSIADDGKTYTFNLQEDAYWQDGEKLSANDVKFTIEYYKEHPPVYNQLMVNGEFIVDSVKVIDENTIQIKTKKAGVAYLEHLGYFTIIPEHIWKDVEDPRSYDGDDKCIGSGPFIVESFNPTEGTYRLVANDKFWGLKPAVDAIEWIAVSDATLSFNNGEIDLTVISPDLVSRYENNDEFTIIKQPALHCYRLMMNQETREEFKDVNLRKAIAYAIDVEDLIQKINRGAAFVSSQGYIPNNSSYYNDDVIKYPYNKEKALELLNGKEYSFTLLTDNSAASTKLCELIKLKLEDVNIHVTIKAIDQVSRDNNIVTGNYEMVVVFYGGMGGDPDYLRNVYSSTSNYIKGWNNKEIDTLLEKQAIEFDAEKRNEQLDKIQLLISQEVPMYLMQGAYWTFVYRDGVYDNWTNRYDHNYLSHIKLSYLERNK
ncbi:MAG: ABC transporter substrate-binding protein [Sphaerochaetaceae bacterium]|nr:ABC transporter substrate-binding protein [Sphaerochaetaceae bacterium]